MKITRRFRKDKALTEWLKTGEAKDSVAVRFVDRRDGEIARFEIHGAVPYEWSGPTIEERGDDVVLTETLVLLVKDTEMVDP